MTEAILNFFTRHPLSLRWLTTVLMYYNSPASNSFEKCPKMFFLSHLILNNTQLPFSKKFCIKRNFFYNFLKTVKSAAILVHHSHQSSSV